MNDINLPNLPLKIPFQRELKNGCLINFEGHVRYGCKNSFAIELLSGPNIVLHTNFRFHDQNELVMNSCNSGDWQEEIRLENPLQYDTDFNIGVQVRQNSFEIFANGQAVGEFQFRYPLNCVQELRVIGNSDVKIRKIKFENFDFSGEEFGQPTCGFLGHNQNIDVRNPVIPFVTPLTRQLKDSSRIRVEGQLRDYCEDSFAIELLSGPNIALHLNFRFKNERVLVMNSCNSGEWEEEIRVLNPLDYNCEFNIEIKMESNRYVIFNNNQIIGEFSFRYPLSIIQALGVKGNNDVEIRIVRVENLGTRHYDQDEYDGGYGGGYGHSGYDNYGTDSYEPPEFPDDHPFRKHFV